MQQPAGRGRDLGALVGPGCVGGAVAGDVVDGVHADERVRRTGAVGGPSGVDAGQSGAEGGVGGAPDVPAVGRQDDQPTTLPAQDEVVVVDQSVVGVAEQHEVGQVGAPAVKPVPHVVGVQAFDAGLRAAGPGAAAVAVQQCPALPRGGAAPAAADCEGLASSLEHDHGGGLAEHAAGLGAGDGGAALVVGAA